MASGTPVVASPNVGAREVLREGRDGLIVADADLGRELIDLLGDADRRAALAATGLTRAADFAWPAVAAAYESVYERLLAARERRPTTPR
jgi:glycosyltransferase involved in cell wall biosynthesis